LGGRVLAPPALVTDNGTGLVTDNGSGLVSEKGNGLVSEHGSGRRALAVPAQVPVPNALVALTDAGGKPILGADGQPITARTGADGRFAFAVALPGQQLIVSVTLAGGKGTLAAIAAAGRDQVDADLVSTLTTGYILDTYVQGQADPVGTLARLPADVEAQTRATAGQALATAGVPVPDSLSSAAVVATVQALRRKDPSLDQQLEVVRRLLIVAGQSDLGNGRPATEVTFRGPGPMLLDLDDTLYFSTFDQRVWRLLADGRVAAVAGGGVKVETGTLTGKPALEAGLATIILGLALDQRGRLVIAEDLFNNLTFTSGGRVSRLEADGRLTELWPSHRNLNGLAVRSEGLVVVEQGDAEHLPSLADLGDGREPRTLPALPPGLAMGSHGVYAFDRQGRLVWRSTNNEALRYDPATTKVETLLSGKRDGLLGLIVDPSGSVLYLDAGRDLYVLRPDGVREKLAAGLDKAFGDAFRDLFTFSALRSDKGVYLGFNNKIFLVAGGKTVQVAGTLGAQTGAAGDAAFELPRGMAIQADGSLAVVDFLAQRIYRVSPAGKTTLLAGTGVRGDGTAADGEAVDATQAKLCSVGTLTGDAAGNLYFAEGTGHGPRLRQIDSHGVLRTIPVAREGGLTQGSDDFRVAPDGTVYFHEEDGFAMHHQVYARKPGEATFKLMGSLPPGSKTAFYPYKFGIYPPNGVFVVGEGQLWRWTGPGTAPMTMLDDAFKNLPTYGNACMDPRGRLYLADQDGQRIRRWDPADAKIVPIAGPGAPHFGGTGVDDSIKWPNDPVVAPNGDLYFSDGGHRQVKRIPAAELD
ncbi:MAG: uncharacterized protein JWM80_6261, partial [Cyanobacteria bacterium RYN_339]|nr:uncharacterized protein [Cyanobacteria bacterium RYN_339]